MHLCVHGDLYTHVAPQPLPIVPLESPHPNLPHHAEF